MSCDVAVKNTLAFLFPNNAIQPALADMVRFVKSLKGDQRMMETAYKISDEKSVFIRFKSEEAMKFTLENNDASLPFFYTSGEKVVVSMSVAGATTRYVRIFDLPPEISDTDLSSVMAKFGKVKRTVRERFPAEYQLDMYTGVRGIYIEIEKVIPEVMYFRNMKGRIYYDGLKLKCFECKSDSHLRKVCPILLERRNGHKMQAKQTVALENNSHGEGTQKNITADGLSSKVDNAESSSGANKAENLMQKKEKKKDPNRNTLSATPPVDRISGEINANDTSASGMQNSTPAPDPPRKCRKERCRIPSYDWIGDENERREIIAYDKVRIATAMNMTVDEIEFFIDKS